MLYTLAIFRMDNLQNDSGSVQIKWWDTLSVNIHDDSYSHPKIKKRCL
jgi:hypothetical protein